MAKYFHKSIFILLFILVSLGMGKSIQFLTNYEKENNKNQILREVSTKLKDCFDLDNKNKRRINDSFELLKFCLEKYGLQ